MLQHAFEKPKNPARVVVMGAGGFIGRNLVVALDKHGIPVLPLTSADIDLAAEGAAADLTLRLKPDDAVVMLSALTPDKGRDVTTFLKNIVMAQVVSDALARQPVVHAVYVSSDAVYAFDHALVNEETPAAPGDLYGCMHRTREIMFQSALKAPVAMLRPTLIYGAGDTHSSYGPNRFRRVAAKDGKITLGGNGEETRDHIYIGDVVELIVATLRHRSAGCLNLATGRSISFFDLANLVVERLPTPAEVVTTPRSAPITHRAFDVTACRKAFPKFVFTPLETGLADAQRDLAG
jgi:nucleoside-diphosphate-sugar epimerase